MDPAEIVAVRDLFESGDETPAIQIILRGTGELMVEAAMDEAEAALIDAGFIETPYDDDAPELTAEEREALDDLYARRFEWLARDADGKLYAFDRKPKKQGAYWDNDPDPGQTKPQRVTEGFGFIDAADEKPWSIPYLLSE